jgi:hypothetical protein
MWTDFSKSQSDSEDSTLPLDNVNRVSIRLDSFSFPFPMATTFGPTMSNFSNIQPLLSSASKAATWTYTTLVILLALLALEQSVYRYKKKHLPGDKWTIPIIGKFADSMKPTLEGYMKQWNSGALSAISVFNMLAFRLGSRIEIHSHHCLLDSLSWHPVRSILARFSTLQTTQNPAW